MGMEHVNGSSGAGRPVADVPLPPVGGSLAEVATWIRARLERDWDRSWRDNLAEITSAWERIGEPAYGLYNRELFRPIHNDLQAEGMLCSPRLPGTMQHSEEEWGPEDFRERRMWTLVHDQRAGGQALGALVVRFFHDHTELRLPRPPTMESVPLTDHDAIREVILQDPRQWAHASDAG
jgi:hypothetical protein